MCYQQFWHIKEREKRKLEAGESLEPSQWQVRLRDYKRVTSRNLWILLINDLLVFQVALFKKLPTRACSRALGKVCDVDLPLWLRKPILGSFSWYFACNVAEAVEEEIVNYPSLGAFFRRQLKPDARKICDASSVVSVCSLSAIVCTQSAGHYLITPGTILSLCHLHFQGKQTYQCLALTGFLSWFLFFCNYQYSCYSAPYMTVRRM